MEEERNSLEEQLKLVSQRMASKKRKVKDEHALAMAVEPPPPATPSQASRSTKLYASTDMYAASGSKPPAPKPSQRRMASPAPSSISAAPSCTSVAPSSKPKPTPRARPVAGPLRRQPAKEVLPLPPSLQGHESDGDWDEDMDESAEECGSEAASGKYGHVICPKTGKASWPIVVSQT